jgi:hypothetical protein
MYVSQQIVLDLRELSALYPSLVEANEILDINMAWTTFFINDAVSVVGFTVHDPTRNNLVYHEKRYDIAHDGSGTRTGTGGSVGRRVAVPSTAVFQSWVIWSQRMLGLSAGQQAQIVSNTGWPRPGAGSTFNATYQGGAWTEGPDYASGPLVARQRTYRMA